MKKTGIVSDLVGVFGRLKDAIVSLEKTSPTLLKWGAYALLAAGALAPLGFILAGISGAIAFLTGPGGIAVAAGALAGFLAYENWDKIQAAVDRVKSGFVQARDELARMWDIVQKNWRSTGLGKLADALGTMASGLRQAGEDVWRQLHGTQAPKVAAANAFSMEAASRYAIYAAANRPGGIPYLGDPGLRPIRPGDAPPLIRDVAPMGPTTVDVTGKVGAVVTGTVHGRMESDVRIKVEGPGRVIEQRSSGGDISGPLKTGEAMQDTVLVP